LAITPLGILGLRDFSSTGHQASVKNVAMMAGGSVGLLLLVASVVVGIETFH